MRHYFIPDDSRTIRIDRLSDNLVAQLLDQMSICHDNTGLALATFFFTLH